MSILLSSSVKWVLLYQPGHGRTWEYSRYIIVYVMHIVNLNFFLFYCNNFGDTNMGLYNLNIFQWIYSIYCMDLLWPKYCMKGFMWKIPTSTSAGAFICSYCVVSEVFFMCYGTLIVICFFLHEIEGFFKKGLISSRLTKNGTGKEFAILFK